MRSTTWVPDAIGVGEQETEGGLLALVLSDEHETLIVPLAVGDARRIAVALLGVEIPDAIAAEVLQ